VPTTRHAAIALERILQARSVTPDHEHHALHRYINNEEAEIHSARCLSLSSRKPSSFVLSGLRWSHRGRAERGLDQSGHLATTCQARCPATKTPHIHRSVDKTSFHYLQGTFDTTVPVRCHMWFKTYDTIDTQLRHCFLIRRAVTPFLQHYLYLT
jgi:hypothetical protein